MGASLQGFQPVDYALIGIAGLTALLAGAACLYTVPWRRGGRGPAKPTRDFNVLWHGRAALSLLSAVWALSQLLRISSIWGLNSLLFPARVTNWTGAGWMCRIYLTVGLGILQPLCAFTALLMLTAGLSRRHRPEALRHPNARLLGLALLCTLPVAAIQAVIAWLGVAVQYRGQLFEQAPRTVLGYFFATYWQGTPQQCGSEGGTSAPAAAAAGGSQAAFLETAADDVASQAAAVADGGCTLCVFPAAAVIAHAVFTAAYLIALWVTCSRLAAAVLNTRLKRRMRIFQASYSLLLIGGTAALGVSIVQGPFSWLNQACWIAYVASVALTVLLVLWEVVVWPVHDLRAVDKRLALWADATTAAFSAAADEMESRSSGGGGGFIKAHNRSTEAEAQVHAAAAARTLAVGLPQ